MWGWTARSYSAVPITEGPTSNDSPEAPPLSASYLAQPRCIPGSLFPSLALTLTTCAHSTLHSATHPMGYLCISEIGRIRQLARYQNMVSTPHVPGCGPVDRGRCTILQAGDGIDLEW